MCFSGGFFSDDEINQVHVTMERLYSFKIISFCSTQMFAVLSMEDNMATPKNDSGKDAES